VRNMASIMPCGLYGNSLLVDFNISLKDKLIQFLLTKIMRNCDPHFPSFFLFLLVLYSFFENVMDPFV
jgi:hypothetical protein